MNNFTKSIVLTAFICLLAFIVLSVIKEVKKPAGQVGVVVTRIDTIKVEQRSVPKMTSEKKPDYFISTLPFPINSSNSSDYTKIIALLASKIDSLQNEIGTIRTFRDSLCLDSIGLKVTVMDSVTSNRIISRQWGVDYLQRTETVQVKEKLKWCLISPGIHLIDKTPGLNIGADIIIKKHILGVTFGMDIEKRSLFLLKYSLSPF